MKQQNLDKCLLLQVIVLSLIIIFFKKLKYLIIPFSPSGNCSKAGIFYNLSDYWMSDKFKEVPHSGWNHLFKVFNGLTYLFVFVGIGQELFFYFGCNSFHFFGSILKQNKYQRYFAVWLHLKHESEKSGTHDRWRHVVIVIIL